MWDAGLTLGYSVRNAAECVKMAAADLKEKTAILDARFLAGDEKLYAQFDKALVSDVLNRDQRNFFKAKLEESRDRHKHYGESIYLLEPQSKKVRAACATCTRRFGWPRSSTKFIRCASWCRRRLSPKPSTTKFRPRRIFFSGVRNSLHFLSKRHTISSPSSFRNGSQPMLGL